MSKKLFFFIIIIFTLIFSPAEAEAATPTVSPIPTKTASPSAPPTLLPSPTIPSTTSATPTLSPEEDEKVKEIRDAIKEKLTQIKEKIEKKAYVGQILEITDSSITLTNFRGKRRIRLTSDTVIILANKKEGMVKDLAVDDKIIAMGEVDSTETLEAKRIVVIPPPKTTPPRKETFLGSISQVGSSNSTLTLQDSSGQTLTLKISQETTWSDLTGTNPEFSFKKAKQNQKVIVVYYQPTQEKNLPQAKSIFLISTSKQP